MTEQNRDLSHLLRDHKDICGLRFQSVKTPIDSMSAFLDAVRDFVPVSDSDGEFANYPHGRASPCRLSVVWARGVASCRFCLNPGLLRREDLFGAEAGNPYGLRKLNELEKELEGLFRTRSTALRQQLEPSGNAAFDLLSSMQHYGAPTRLLDWTGNPLSALYFALDGYLTYRERVERYAPEAQERIPGVWLFRPRPYNQQIHNFSGVVTAWDEAPLRELLSSVSPTKHAVAIMPSTVTPRISAQQSRFTLHSFAFDSIERAFSEYKNQGSRVLLRLLAIEPTKAHQMFGELRDMGTHEFSLFPDMEGLGNYSKKLWREALFNIEEDQKKKSLPGD